MTPVPGRWPDGPRRGRPCRGSRRRPSRAERYPGDSAATPRQPLPANDEALLSGGLRGGEVFARGGGCGLGRGWSCALWRTLDIGLAGQGLIPRKRHDRDRAPIPSRGPWRSTLSRRRPGGSRQTSSSFRSTDPVTLTESAEGLDRLLDGRLARLIEEGEIRGKRGSVALTHTDGRSARVASAPPAWARSALEAGFAPHGRRRRRPADEGGRRPVDRLARRRQGRPVARRAGARDRGGHATGRVRERPVEDERGRRRPASSASSSAAPARPREPTRRRAPAWSSPGRTAAATSSTLRRTSSRPSDSPPGPRRRPPATRRSASRPSARRRSAPQGWARSPPSARGATTRLA